MVLMVPLLIMATSLVSKINTRVALVKGWVNSSLAFMGQLYIGFYILQGLRKTVPMAEHQRSHIPCAVLLTRESPIPANEWSPALPQHLMACLTKYGIGYNDLERF